MYGGIGDILPGGGGGKRTDGVNQQRVGVRRAGRYLVIRIACAP
jgi:hypothetical protein